MTELTLTLIRVAFLAVLWLFVIAAHHPGLPQGQQLLTLQAGTSHWDD